MKNKLIFVALMITLSLSMVRSVYADASYNPAQHFDLPTPANASLPTLFLVGDSLVAKGNPSKNQVGWGVPFADYFDLSKINVVNRSINGRSSRTYLTEGHWNDVLALMKPGDIVIFHLGANDGGRIDDPNHPWGSLKGIGDQTQDITNPITNKPETVHTYGWYMSQYIANTLAKGAIPIICSPTPRHKWKGANIERSPYAAWDQQIAAAQNVAFVDLNDIVAKKYEQMGESGISNFYEGNEITHFNAAGADFVAQSVVEGLKALPSDPLINYFSAKGASVMAN